MIKHFLTSKNELTVHISFISTVMYIIIIANFINYVLINASIFEYAMLMLPLFIIYMVTVIQKRCGDAKFIMKTIIIKLIVITIIFQLYVLPPITTSCGSSVGELIRSRLDRVYFSLFVYVWPYFQYDLISLYLLGYKKMYFFVLCVFLLLILILTIYIVYFI